MSPVKLQAGFYLFHGEMWLCKMQIVQWGARLTVPLTPWATNSYIIFYYVASSEPFLFSPSACGDV